MIGSLRGKIVFAGANRVLLDVGGVGYEVAVSIPTMEALSRDGEVFLHVYTSVRENALELYGFNDVDEKKLFEMLIGVSGVGPRTALAILSATSPDDFRQAVLGGNLAQLTKIPGIGKKSAERLVLELKEKIKKSGVEGKTALNPGRASLEEDLVSSLMNLGYSEKQARGAARRVLEKSEPTIQLTQAVKTALKELMVSIQPGNKE